MHAYSKHITGILIGMHAASLTKGVCSSVGIQAFSDVHGISNCVSSTACMQTAVTALECCSRGASCMGTRLRIDY